MNLFRKLPLFFIACVITACSKNDIPVNTGSSTFTNPLLPGGPDPWVVFKDGYYYYTQTLGNRIQLWKTRALSGLNGVNPVVIWRKPATGPNSENIWAPELHFLDNKWYLYFTAGSLNPDVSQRLFVLENSAADPTTLSWVDRGQLRDTANDFWAIDADVFEFKGKRYVAWSGHPNGQNFDQHIYVASLTNPWTVGSSRIDISAPTFDWERVGSPPAVNEAPQAIVNPSGRLLLIYSASGCWTDSYSMGILQLKEAGDPLVASDWIKSPVPVFTSKPENGAFGVGHCAFFKSPDGSQDWFLYHANRQPGMQCGDGRSPRMQQFSWRNDGTPNFGEPVKINTAISKPSGE